MGAARVQPQEQLLCHFEILIFLPLTLTDGYPIVEPVDHNVLSFSFCAQA